MERSKICIPCSMENLALNMEKVYLNSHKKLMKSLLEVKGFSWDEIYPLKLRFEVIDFFKTV